MELTFTNIVAFLIIYISLYGIVDRICKCLENRANAKAFKSYLDHIVDRDKEN